MGTRLKISLSKHHKGVIVEKFETLLDEVSNKDIYQFMQEAISKIYASDKPIDLSSEIDCLFDERLAEFKKLDDKLKTKISEYLKNVKPF